MQIQTLGMRRTMKHKSFKVSDITHPDTPALQKIFKEHMLKYGGMMFESPVKISVASRIHSKAKYKIECNILLDQAEGKHFFEASFLKLSPTFKLIGHCHRLATLESIAMLLEEFDISFKQYRITL